MEDISPGTRILWKWVISSLVGKKCWCPRISAQLQFFPWFIPPYPPLSVIFWGQTTEQLFTKIFAASHCNYRLGWDMLWHVFLLFMAMTQEISISWYHANTIAVCREIIADSCWHHAVVDPDMHLASDSFGLPWGKLLSRSVKMWGTRVLQKPSGSWRYHDLHCMQRWTLWDS